MAASRLGRAASFGMAAATGLLAAALFAGCGFQREFVRRGQVLDSMDVRLARVEQAQQRRDQEIAKLRADVLTETERIDARLDQFDARIADMAGRINRISLRVGAGRGDITPVPTDSRPTTDTTPRPTDTVGVEEDQLYNTAYLDFTRGKYDVAISEFRRYLEDYPQSDNADNAQYWIGECFYSLGRLDSAEAGFRRVMVAFPRGNKVPAAEYKLGLVYLAQNRKPEAKNQLRRVAKLYPGTNEARLAQDRLLTLEQ
jgi:tol-pal system protein YbgF